MPFLSIGGVTRSTAATTAKSGSLATTGGASSAAATKTTKPIEEVKDGESSGYSDFDEEELDDEFDAAPTATAAKAQLAAEKAKKEAIKTYQNEKAKAGNSTLINESALLDQTDNTGGKDASAMNISLDTENLNALW